MLITEDLRVCGVVALKALVTWGTDRRWPNGIVLRSMDGNMGAKVDA